MEKGFLDVMLTCTRCSKSFKYSASEQAFFKSKSFAPPKFCGDCRQIRKQEATVRSSSSNVWEEVGSINNGKGSGKRKSHEESESGRIEVPENAIKRRKSNGKEDAHAIKSGVAGESKKEVNPHRIEMRLKQIQFGYNTTAYDNYIAQVPKNQRSTRYDEHPRTPDPYAEQSKRAFDGRIRKWRRELHRWDPSEGALGESVKYRVAPKGLTDVIPASTEEKTHESSSLKSGNVVNEEIVGERVFSEEDLDAFGDDSALDNEWENIKIERGEDEGEDEDEDIL